MRLRKRALAVISASLFLVAGLLPSVAVAEDTGPWAIGIYEFPKCLEVEGGSTADSAQVQLWSCDETKNHRTWYMQEVQSGWWHIKNTKSGKCLNVQAHPRKTAPKSFNIPVRVSANTTTPGGRPDSGWAGKGQAQHVSPRGCAGSWCPWQDSNLQPAVEGDGSA